MGECLSSRSCKSLICVPMRNSQADSCCSDVLDFVSFFVTDGLCVECLGGTWQSSNVENALYVQQNGNVPCRGIASTKYTLQHQERKRSGGRRLGPRKEKKVGRRRNVNIFITKI